MHKKVSCANWTCNWMVIFHVAQFRRAIPFLFYATTRAHHHHNFSRQLFEQRQCRTPIYYRRSAQSAPEPAKPSSTKKSPTPKNLTSLLARPLPRRLLLQPGNESPSIPTPNSKPQAMTKTPKNPSPSRKPSP